MMVHLSIFNLKIVLQRYEILLHILMLPCMYAVGLPGMGWRDWKRAKCRPSLCSWFAAGRCSHWTNKQHKYKLWFWCCWHFVTIPTRKLWYVKFYSSWQKYVDNWWQIDVDSLYFVLVHPLEHWWCSSYLTNIVVRTSITVRLTDTWIQVLHNCFIVLINLGLKEERLEVHGGVADNVHEDGRHVNCHENTQETSSKDNLGWLL